MIYPAAILLAILPLIQGLLSPVGVIGLADDVKKDQFRTRHVRILIKGVKQPKKKNPPKGEPQIGYTVPGQYETTAWTQDKTFEIKQKDHRGEKAIDPHKEIVQFEFKAGEQWQFCTIRMDENLPWANDDAKNTATFTFQAGEAFVWPCGVGNQPWAQIDCPPSTDGTVKGADCSGAGWV